MPQPAVGRSHGGHVKVASQALKGVSVLGMHQQRVAVLLIEAGESARQVADIRADSEVAHSANVDRDMERVGLWRHRISLSRSAAAYR